MKIAKATAPDQTTNYIIPTVEEVANLRQLSSDQLLQQKKELKKAEIKALRDNNIKKPTPQTISYQGNLANKSFTLTQNDLSFINAIICDLEDKIAAGINNPTREWTSAQGRFALNIDDFKSLRAHVVHRDEQEFSQATLKINLVKSMTSVEEVEGFNINQIII